MVRAISVYSAGVPYAARFTVAVKIPLPPLLRFSSRICFNRKLFRQTMDQTKSIELQKKLLESAEERARARASSACAQTH